jgi:hypothetical protein
VSAKDVVIRGAGVLVVAGVLIGGGAYVVGDGGATANLWVGAAGTCTDEATPIAYDAAKACDTLDAANDTCDNGDTVRVNETVGSSATGTTTLTGSNGRSAACVVRAPITGENFTVTGTLVLDETADWLTIHEPTWTNQTPGAGNGDEYAQFHNYGDNNSYINPDSSSFQVFGGDNVLIDGGDIGPCYSDVANPICEPRIKGSSEAAKPSAVTLSDTVIHDQTADTTPGSCGSDSCHTSGMGVFGSGTGIVLERNKFYNNQVTNIRVQNCCSITNDGLTIRNSMFGIAYASGAFTTATFNTLDIDSAVPGLYVGFNSFGYDTSCGTGVGCGSFITCDDPDCGSSGSPATFVGNLVGMSSTGTCMSSVTWTYNVFRQWSDGSTTTPCSGTGNTLNVYNSALPPYTTIPANLASGVIDFHITGAAWDGDSQVTSGCLPTDYDGDARTSTCDAGADER